MGTAGTEKGAGFLVIPAERENQIEAFPWENAVGIWHVLHTRSRQEKALSDELGALGICHYLPLVNQARFYGRRKAEVALPLFPGYVFLKGTTDQTFVADRTRRVAGIIPVRDQRQLECELRNISAALSREGVLDPYPHLVVGAPAEVRSGPFRGIQGVVEKRIGFSDRLILQVRMLGMAVSLEIEGALLDPI